MDGVVDRLDALVDRHKRALSIIGGAWFVVGCTIASGMVRVPDLGIVSSRNALLIATLYNAIWWGYFHPRAEKRRVERLAGKAQKLESGNDG